MAERTKSDPEAELYYNDYGMNIPGRRNTVIKLINDLKASGLRIDGVGMQGHMGMDYPNIQVFEESLLAYAATGVKVSITEWDMTALPSANTGADVADRPEGPFIPQPDPIRGSYSMDIAVLKEGAAYYLYFGGLWGGQLQRYQDNKALEKAYLPEGDAPALPSRVVRLSEDMLQFAEEPKPAVIVDGNGEPLKADHPHRFFEASWVHKYQGKYYFSYSTGDTHKICYAIGDNPYGPFTYQGVILTPVVGWTTHHSIVEYNTKANGIFFTTKVFLRAVNPGFAV